jgi:hypothetical protein
LRTIKPPGSGLELRCATSEGRSVHDALPPSYHPSGRQYEWVFEDLLAGDWRNLPAIPASLLSVWRQVIGDEATAQFPPETTPSAFFDLLEKLRKAAFRHSPDCEYDEWIKVGMQLHEGTDGDGAGLDIWCEWSRGITRKPYPGDLYLKRKWLTMGRRASTSLYSSYFLVNKRKGRRGRRS